MKNKYFVKLGYNSGLMSELFNLHLMYNYVKNDNGQLVLITKGWLYSSNDWRDIFLPIENVKYKQSWWFGFLINRYTKNVGWRLKIENILLLFNIYLGHQLLNSARIYYNNWKYDNIILNNKTNEIFPFFKTGLIEISDKLLFPRINLMDYYVIHLRRGDKFLEREFVIFQDYLSIYQSLKRLSVYIIGDDYSEIEKLGNYLRKNKIDVLEKIPYMNNSLYGFNESNFKLMDINSRNRLINEYIWDYKIILNSNGLIGSYRNNLVSFVKVNTNINVFDIDNLEFAFS